MLRVGRNSSGGHNQGWSRFVRYRLASVLAHTGSETIACSDSLGCRVLAWLSSSVCPASGGGGALLQASKSERVTRIEFATRQTRYTSHLLSVVEGLT